MGVWTSDNYGRMIDLFRKFDADQSGRLSYDEFFQGMKELGERIYFQIHLYSVNDSESLQRNL